MNLYNRISGLVNGHRVQGCNEILSAFSLEMCQQIDLESDSFTKKATKEILNLLKDYSTGYSDKLRSAFEIYTECAIFLEIKSKGFVIEKVTETNKPSPDFKICYGEEYVYFEAKILGWASGGIQHKTVINSSLNEQLSIKNQLDAGARIASAAVEIEPLGSTEESYKNPEKYFIEAVAKKLSQNAKASQFQDGPTFLICDLTSLYHPANPAKSSVIVHNDNMYSSFSSGELWHIAFGNYGDRILKAISFEGDSNVSGELRTNGILIEYPELLGIVFRTSNLSKDYSYSCIIRSENFNKYGKLVTELCTSWNDEKNSNAWKL